MENKLKLKELHKKMIKLLADIDVVDCCYKMCADKFETTKQLHYSDMMTYLNQEKIAKKNEFKTLEIFEEKYKEKMRSNSIQNEVKTIYTDISKE